MSGIRSGTRTEQLAALRARTHQELQSLERTLLVDSGRADVARIERLWVLRDRLDDELGQPRVKRPAAQRRRRKRPLRTRGPQGPNRVDLLLVELGVSAHDVKEWALDEGLITAIVRGRVGAALVDAYAEAHQ